MTKAKKKFYLSPSPTSPIDWFILMAVFGLVLFGVIMVFDASIVESYYQFADKYHFAKLQLMWSGIGIIALIISAYIPLKWVRSISPAIFALAIILLVLTLIPGLGVKVQGARRWLSIGNIQLQPSELTKLAAAIYFPAWLTKHQRLGPFITLMGILVVLLMLEPDLGTTLIIVGMTLSLFFVSGAKLRTIAGIIVGGTLLGFILIAGSSYRRARLQTFLDPTGDPLGASYHIRQVLLSLGSGGLTGTGIGRSRQKYQYLPEATTDSIFAVIAEETGFIGASFMIIIFLVIISRGLQLTRHITDSYAQLLAIAIISWLALQSILNLAAMVSLVPLTGLPLPLISYGGSSLVTMMAGIGLLLNTTRYRQTKNHRQSRKKSV